MLKEKGIKNLKYSTKIVMRSNVLVKKNKFYLVKTLSLYPKTASNCILFLPDVCLTEGHRKVKRKKAREIHQGDTNKRKQGEKY